MHTPLTISLSVTPARFVLLQPDIADWTAAVEGPVDPGVIVATAEEVVVARGTSGEEREVVQREKREKADRRNLILDLSVMF